MLTVLQRAAALSTVIVTSTATWALAQETPAEPQHPEMPGAETTSPTAPGHHGHMMKIVFAILDADGDGGLSFEEISAILRRIFDTVDADRGGTLTTEELQGFMDGMGG